MGPPHCGFTLRAVPRPRVVLMGGEAALGTRGRRAARSPQPEPSPAPELPAFPEAAAPPGAVPLCCPGTAAPLLLRSTHGGLHSRSGRGSLICGGQPALGRGVGTGWALPSQSVLSFNYFPASPPAYGANSLLTAPPQLTLSCLEGTSHSPKMGDRSVKVLFITTDN